MTESQDERYVQACERLALAEEKKAAQMAAMAAHLANLVAALAAISKERVATALGPMAAMNGVSAVDILAGLFKGSPLEEPVKALATRARMPALKAGE